MKTRIILISVAVLITFSLKAQEFQMVKDIDPTSGGSSPFFITENNGKLYFSANNGTSGEELWVTDGTEVGTQMVKDINPVGDSHLGGFTVYNNKDRKSTRLNSSHVKISYAV